MTKLFMKSGVNCFTDLSVHEVRNYLQGGSQTGTISGYTDEGKGTEILISVAAIQFIYK